MAILGKSEIKTITAKPESFHAPHYLPMPYECDIVIFAQAMNDRIKYLKTKLEIYENSK